MGISLIAVFSLLAAGEPAEPALQPIKYNHPGLVVDLGAGLWAQPLPCDYDGDGDMDMVVSCPDVPYNGTYLFENTSGIEKFPVLGRAVRLGPGIRNTTISYLEDGWHFLRPGAHYASADFRKSGFDKPVKIPFKPKFHIGRDNQWKLVDYDGDGALDLIVGASDWREYGWDNAFNEKGEWTRGPLHGYVYWMRNGGTDAAPVYAEPVNVEAAGRPVDVYGCPSPNFVDMDGDGDLDLICGEFLDKITYFQNVGTRSSPQYAAGRFLTHGGNIIHMDLEMIQVIAVDWDGDGDSDLVVGQEDGRVALMENTGHVEEGMPQFLLPKFFQQQADNLKTGALSTPYVADWDGDGWDDIIAGDTAGYINFVKNLDGGCPPKWAAPVYLEADGEVIRIQAGPNGSIQGPCEAKWGYTVVNVADWDGDGLPDIVINSIWGKVLWYRNIGERTAPKLAGAQPVEVEWEGAAPKPAWTWWTPDGKGLVTQWRTSPVVIDLNRDGLNDLVMLDQEGYLVFFERREGDAGLVLLPPSRIFHTDNGEPLRLNQGRAGKSGRRKLAFTDWDGDGRLDLIANGENAEFWRNVGDSGRYVFKNEGKMDTRKLAGHTTCPAIADWNRDGIPDLVLGAEDGFFYYMANPRAK
ncbi:MAG TPA: VCBS repeat-containing protein [Candidatus Bathyarchaeia archaeon]|nr:VCBS repeat-containing protein [Candidatus Bathyarchaeia archaeon]